MTPSDTQLRDLLDGGLDPEAREALEKRIADEPALRERIVALAGETRFRDDFNPGTSRPVDSHSIQGLIEKLKTEGADDPAETQGAHHSESLQPSDAPGSRGRLGDYEIEEVIATGGMGIIYRARDPDLKRSVAIKLLSPALAASPEARVRFLREAAGMAAIDHPNILPIHAIEKDAEAPYIVMRLVEGKSLQEYLDELAPDSSGLPLPEIIEIAGAIASGLAAAHSAGLIHRDVKPSNILLEKSEVPDRRFHPFLTDFGIARAAEEPGLTRTGTFLGTPQYMSPEQAEGTVDLDPRSDLFSLGAVLYTMATGTPPFAGESFNALVRTIQETAPSDPRKQNPNLPAWLANLIIRLLAKNPRDRPESAAEVAETIAKETNLGTISLVRLLGRRTRLRRMAIRVGLAAAAVFAISTTTFIVAERSGKTAIINAFLCGISGDAFYIHGKWGTHSTLADTVSAAMPGDVVLVRTNETLEVPECIDIPSGKPLTIRAVDGFAPDLYSPRDVLDSFIATASPLLLDGLIFRKVADKARLAAPMIVSESAPLTILNCRFARPELHAELEAPPADKAVIHLRDCPSFHLLNSEVYSRHGVAVHADYDGALAQAFMRFLNCQVRAQPLTLALAGPTALDVAMSRNTFLGERGIGIITTDSPPTADFILHGNFFQTRFSTLDTNFETAEELRRRVRWRGGENIYLARIGFLSLLPRPGSRNSEMPARTLDAWRALWGPGTVEVGSVHSQEQSSPPPGAIFEKLSEPVPMPVPFELFENPPAAGPNRATLGPGPGRAAIPSGETRAH